MNITMRTLLIGSLLLLNTLSPAIAQRRAAAVSPAKQPRPTRYHIGALTRSCGDSVMVRWAPADALLFKAAVRSGGYALTRRTVNADRSITTDFRVAVKPWTIEEWKQRVSPRDTLAGVCVQLLYGKNEPLSSTEAVSLDKLMQQKNQNDLRMAIALVLADANPVHARGMGLGFVDKNVKRGARYVYSVTALTDTTLYPSDTAAAMVINDGPGERPAMVPVRAEAGDRTVSLVWSRALADAQFTAYYVERSTDGGKTFRRINQRPWIQPPTGKFAQVYSFADSVAQNYRSYQYRVLGLTPFGELSTPSATVSIRGIDRTPPEAVTDVRTTHLKASQVRITWQRSKTEGDLAGYFVAKANSTEGPFLPLTSRLLPGSQREFIDTTALPFLPTYYMVVAVDTARNASRSLPAYCFFNDTKGPAKPKNLQGYIDSTGFVRIVWDRNTEPDLLGYSVIAANDPSHVFTAETPGFLAIPVFNDTTTLRTLTRKIYYRVIAYDKNRNPSEPSDILALTRPDKLRPVAPVISTYTVGDTTVTLAWSRSSSDDVARQIVLRRESAVSRWTEVKTIDKTQTSFADSGLKPNTAYSYALVAVDSAGLRSDESFPLHTKTLRLSPRPISDLTVRVGPDQKTVSLVWSYPRQDVRFVVYRAMPQSGLRSYDSVNRITTYDDNRVSAGQYEYAVRVIYPDGTESNLSNLARVTIH